MEKGKWGQIFVLVDFNNPDGTQIMNSRSAPAVNLQFAVPKFHLIKKEDGQYRRKNQSKEYSQEEYYPKEYYMVFIYFFFSYVATMFTQGQ